MGMAIDPELWCCTVDPASQAEYFACPPGSTYDPVCQLCVYPEILGPGDTECLDGTVAFNPCEQTEKKCRNPDSYGDQASCEAAGCTWNTSAAGGGGYCTE